MVDSRFFKVHPKKIGDIAKLTNATLTIKTAAASTIKGIAGLSLATKDDLSFFEISDHVRRTLSTYKEQLKNTKAAGIFIREQDKEFLPKNTCGLIVENPREAYRLAAESLYPIETKTGIEKSAIIDSSVKFADKKTVAIGHHTIIEEDVEIGKNVSIGHHVIIKKGCVINDNTIIHNNITISHAIIGKNCTIFDGVTLGSAGFGYASSAKGHAMIPQLGRVIIGNHVDIGANSCIDRGASADTIIGDGTKIDNLVQIGHGAIVGKNCFICGQTGLAGNTKLEDFVIAGAQSGFAGHLTIGTGSQIAGQSGIISSLPPQSKVVGFPARPIKEFYKEIAFLKSLIKKRK